MLHSRLDKDIMQYQKNIRSQNKWYECCFSNKWKVLLSINQKLWNFTGLRFKTKLKINHYCLRSFFLRKTQTKIFEALPSCNFPTKQNKVIFFPYFDVLSAAIPRWLWCNQNKRRRRMTIAIDKREISSVFNVRETYQCFRW